LYSIPPVRRSNVARLHHYHLWCDFTSKDKGH
jgi:hypothetical protein